MSIEKVIETGNIGVGFWEIVSNTNIAWFLLVLLISGVLGAFYLFLSSETTKSRLLHFFIPFIVIMIIGSCFLMLNSGADIQDKKIEHWKTEVAYPYIESLEVVKSEVVYIKISPQLEYTNLSWRGRYINSEKLQPLTISYKVGKDALKTITNWYDASMSLSASDVPYVEYHHLDRDLPNGVSVGDYYPKVYLPANYKFTDIK